MKCSAPTPSAQHNKPLIHQFGLGICTKIDRGGEYFEIKTSDRKVLVFVPLVDGSSTKPPHLGASADSNQFECESGGQKTKSMSDRIGYCRHSNPSKPATFIQKHIGDHLSVALFTSVRHSLPRQHSVVYFYGQ